jgi:hypothetical protein
MAPQDFPLVYNDKIITTGGQECVPKYVPP